MRFRPADDLLELSAAPVMGEEDFGSVAAGAGGPSFFIAVEVDEIEARVHLVDQSPEIDPDADEVVEFSCLGPGVLFDPHNPGQGSELTVVEDRGPHRVRLSIVYKSQKRGTWDFVVWPASPAPARVLVDPDAAVRFDYLALPEANDGLLAAARIGRDVDRLPDARVLSGETGTARVSRVCTGPISGHRPPFYGPHTWTVSATGDRWHWDQNRTYYPPDPDHPDQLAGRTGMLVARPVTPFDTEWSGVRPKPPIVVDVNWYVSDTAPRACVDPTGGSAFLPAWTRQRATFKRATAAGGPASTEITVEHSGLPVEWVDDLTAWWTFQLAIRDAYQPPRSMR